MFIDFHCMKSVMNIEEAREVIRIDRNGFVLCLRTPKGKMRELMCVCIDSQKCTISAIKHH